MILASVIPRLITRSVGPVSFVAVSVFLLFLFVLTIRVTAFAVLPSPRLSGLSIHLHGSSVCAQLYPPLAYLVLSVSTCLSSKKTAPLFWKKKKEKKTCPYSLGLSLRGPLAAVDAARQHARDDGGEGNRWFVPSMVESTAVLRLSGQLDACLAAVTDRLFVPALVFVLFLLFSSSFIISHSSFEQPDLLRET